MNAWEAFKAGSTVIDCEICFGSGVRHNRYYINGGQTIYAKSGETCEFCSGAGWVKDDGWINTVIYWVNPGQHDPECPCKKKL